MTIDVNEAPALRDELEARVARLTVDVPPTDSIVVRARRRQRHQRRRRVALLGAAASVAIVAGLFAGTRETRVVVSPAATGDLTEPLPAVPQVVVDGWSTTYFVALGGYTEYQMTRGEQRLQLSFYGPDDYEERVQGDDRAAVVVRGHPASLLDYGDGRFRADWSEGGRTWEADGAPFADRAEFLSTLETVRSVDAATWEAAMPHGTVTQEGRAAAVGALLQDVPLPPDFDPATFDAGPPAMRYYLVTEVLGGVACRWLDLWSADPTAAAGIEAAAALATARDWDGLVEIDAKGGYAQVLWGLTDRVAAGDTAIAGPAESDPKSAPMTQYQAALGCGR